MDKTQKRKAVLKTNKCDICGRMFAGIGGIKTHKTRSHGVYLKKPTFEKETVEVLTRSHSVRSETSLSPPPKKIFFAPKQIATVVLVELGEAETKQEPAIGLASHPPTPMQVEQLQPVLGLGGPAQDKELAPAIQVHQLLPACDHAGELPLGKPALGLSGEAVLGGPTLTADPVLAGQAALA